MNKTLATICLILIFACTSKNEFEPVYDVPAEFQPIIETFISEARQRGFNYRIDNLILRYDDELDNIFCGKSNVITQENNIQKIILLNPKKCWINEYQEEAVIFHELGHCFLGRMHKEDLLPNGDPKSMMVKDNISVYSPCVYAFGELDECNFTYKRAYYLDELFNENTSIPDWAKQ